MLLQLLLVFNMFTAAAVAHLLLVPALVLAAEGW
jgi:hypothetical protein